MNSATEITDLMVITVIRTPKSALRSPHFMEAIFPLVKSRVVLLNSSLGKP
jgi:hypothetical protein